MTVESQSINAKNVPAFCKSCPEANRYLKIDWDKNDLEGLEWGINRWMYNNMQAKIEPTPQSLCYALSITEEEFYREMTSNTPLGRVYSIAEQALIGRLMMKGKSRVAELWVKNRKGWKDTTDINTKQPLMISLEELKKYDCSSEEIAFIQGILDRFNGE